MLHLLNVNSSSALRDINDVLHDRRVRGGEGFALMILLVGGAEKGETKSSDNGTRPEAERSEDRFRASGF